MRKKDVATRWNSEVVYGIRCIEWLGCGFKDFVSSPLIPQRNDMKLSNLTSIFFIQVEPSTPWYFGQKYRFLLHTLLPCWGSKRGSYFRKQLGAFSGTPRVWYLHWTNLRRSLFTFKGVTQGPKFIWTLDHQLQGETGMLTLKDFDFW